MTEFCYFVKHNKGNMSRRSSATSLTTSASASTADDPLMRDCYDLRRRLMETEQSINKLNPPLKKTSRLEC